jgi:hypothetical protein
MFRTETKVLHFAPTAHWFFNGSGGYQILARMHYFFGFKYRTEELDREDVPHWHYVQQRTLGLSEWRSRLLAEHKEEGK